MSDTATSPDPPQTSASDKLDKSVLLVVGVVVLGAIMSILDITIVTGQDMTRHQWGLNRAGK
jgi:hypothetical protein